MFKNVLKTLVLFISFQSLVFSQQTIKYNLKPNDSFIFHQKVEQTITQDIEGTSHTVDNSIEGVFVLKVKKVTDSSFIMSFAYKKFAVDSKSNLYGDIIHVNTDSINAKDPQSKVFSALTRSTLSFEMNKYGKIIKFQGTETLIQDMIDNAGFENDYTKAVMAEYMEKEFGNEKMTNSLQQMTLIYSKKPLSPNGTWTTQLQGDFKAQNTWKLKNTENSKLNINGTGEVSMASDDETYKLTLKGSSTTALNVNKNNGMINTMEVVSNMEGVSIVKGPEPIKIPMKISSLTTYKALKNVQ
ncbi:MAG: DUF6263 family protein [Flavobacteriaceae bacterium]|nr:hypothetical protein [Flavobacteriaceae bacterium]HRV56308.1 DUF6263 family protein [Mangrovimonas sp.]